MGKGYLKVELRYGEDLFPVSGTRVLIKDMRGRVLHTLTTDESGNAAKVMLDAPGKAASLTPNKTPGDYTNIYSAYNVEVPSTGRYKTAIVHGVQIFDTETTILKINMLPIIQGEKPEESVNEIYIPAEHGVDMEKHQVIRMEAGSLLFKTMDYTEAEPGGLRTIYAPLANEVAIPEYITVHLGHPDAQAENVKVPFKEYLKNVASSEIYSTWPKASLEANIYAQISFALNRINTAWYRSRGFSFDITSSTAVDQMFVQGRDIFQNLSDIVDGIFNMFIRRAGHLEPFISQYCNGTTSTCPGLSQWGTVPLAEQGYSYIEILRYYFPNDINIVMSNNFGPGFAVFGGISLKEGSTGEDVRRMQISLNRISGNFPLIPVIKDPNGVFDVQTTEAVTTFQETFDLEPDGIIGKKTWYEVIRIFVGVARLAELDSEGVRIGIGIEETPPTSVISLGAKGEDVVKLKFLINYIAQYYPPIPYIPQTGVYDETTRNAVIEFQRYFKLNPDGIVGPVTWNKLFDVYRAIQANNPKPAYVPTPMPISPPFPGYFMRSGQNGDNIMLMQRYLNRIRTAQPSIPLLKEDGIFGPATEQAVKEFQRLYGLKPDGIIGPMTWSKVITVYNTVSALSIDIGVRQVYNAGHIKNSTNPLALLLALRMMNFR